MGCSCSSNAAPVITPEMIGRAVKMGLIEAAKYAETMTSETGRFTNSETIKITLPEEINKARPVLDSIEKGGELDNLEEQINVAAEMACQGCAGVFEGAITKLEVEDAAKLLKDESDTSCTDLLREKCEADLRELMTPPVQRAMDESDVNKVWTGIQEAYKEASEAANSAGQGFLGKLVDAAEDATGLDLDGVNEQAEELAEKKPELEFDLEGYIVGKAMEAIFTFIAEKEAVLRANPTDAAAKLIKDVFAKYSSQCSAAPVVQEGGGDETQALLAK